MDFNVIAFYILIAFIVSNGVVLAIVSEDKGLKGFSVILITAGIAIDFVYRSTSLWGESVYFLVLLSIPFLIYYYDIQFKSSFLKGYVIVLWTLILLTLHVGYFHIRS